MYTIYINRFIEYKLSLFCFLLLNCTNAKFRTTIFHSRWGEVICFSSQRDIIVHNKLKFPTQNKPLAWVHSIYAKFSQKVNLMPCTATFPFATKIEMARKENFLLNKEGKRKEDEIPMKTIPILWVSIHIHFNDEGVRTIHI